MTRNQKITTGIITILLLGGLGFVIYRKMKGKVEEGAAEEGGGGGGGGGGSTERAGANEQTPPPPPPRMEPGGRPGSSSYVQQTVYSRGDYRQPIPRPGATTMSRPPRPKLSISQVQASTSGGTVTRR